MTIVPPVESIRDGREKNRIAGLDTLRFVFALVVAFGHGLQPPITAGYDGTRYIARALNALYAWSFNGQAAVIMFFLISGFCIHYPYRNGRQVDPGAFYVRRMLRIAIPAIAAILLSYLIGLTKPWSDQGIPAWSLYCELLYYLAYPVMVAMRQWLPWPKMTLIAFVVSFVSMTALDITKGSFSVFYHNYNILFVAMHGLPCWLLGVLLADNWDQSSGRVVSWRTIAVFRSTAWMLSVGFMILAFEGGIGLPFSCNLFAILGYFWLRAEVVRFAKTPPPAFLEKCGQASYTLYLVHWSAIHLFSRSHLQGLGHMVDWLLEIAFTGAITWGFHLLVEQTSHGFAKTCAFSLERHSSCFRQKIQGGLG